MPKRLIKRYLPDPHSFREHKHLRVFGERLHDPNLWHLNRRSVAGALGAGVFTALVPFPGQMIAAAAAAMVLRVNLPLSVVTVWITNPFTFAPIFYFTYRVGAWLLGMPQQAFTLQFSIDWLLQETGNIWLPLVVGSLFVGAVLSVIVYATVRVAWRLYIIIRRRRFVRHRRTLKPPSKSMRSP
jgi:uncharacterized protein (DUF2062 family)